MATAKTSLKPAVAPVRTARARKGRGPPQHPRDRVATRQRLLDAAIEIVRARGVDALSTVSVTRAAGIVQSGFYVHFRNLDDCKRAAAEQVAARVRQFVAAHRRAGYGAPADLSSMADHYRVIMSLFQTERWFSQLLIRYRHDPSPLGLVFRQVLDGMRADLAADLRAQFEPLLPPGQDPARFAVYAELLQGMVIQAGEAMLEGRIADEALLARELAAAAMGMGRAVLEPR